ncbi:PREDICTED: keratin-associated protein 13-1-like [Condylura cristata]|uniref:keratin-associated protein 13-1-like n=1 Tax=Condylura cristata TaxID=143302 RepID=UPI0006430398|nr:PREDICTED: keratin-associated protein 13-1-like [Condylura cristata]
MSKTCSSGNFSPSSPAACQSNPTSSYGSSAPSNLVFKTNLSSSSTSTGPRPSSSSGGMSCSLPKPSAVLIPCVISYTGPIGGGSSSSGSQGYGSGSSHSMGGGSGGFRPQSHGGCGSHSMGGGSGGSQSMATPSRNLADRWAPHLGTCRLEGDGKASAAEEYDQLKNMTSFNHPEQHVEDAELRSPGLAENQKQDCKDLSKD